MNEEQQKALEALPRLACGALAYPGREIYTHYLGEVWEARIVNVGDGVIDLQYTNAANHRAKGCTSRLRPAAEWFAKNLEMI